MQRSVKEPLEELRSLHETHLQLGAYMLKANGGALFLFDLLAIAALNRSICLLSGFNTLIENKNFLAAAPLLRLQLDNCLRFSAGWLVDKPHEFALKVFEGVPVRKQRDKSGKLMTDRYLVEKLSEKHLWVAKVYEATSGYVHLSEKHFFNVVRSTNKEREVNLKISDRDEFIPDEVYLEAIEAFKATTNLLFDYVYGWAYTKNNPQIVEKMRKVLAKNQ